MNFLGLQRDIDPINSQTIFSLWGFPINNTTLSIVLVTFFVIFSYIFFIRKFKMRPGKLQVFIEMVYGEINNFIFQIVSNRKRTSDLIPIIGSLFVFLFLSNLLSVLPIIGNITFDGKPIFRAPTADYSTTFSIALGSLIVIHILMIKNFGIFGYIEKFLKFKTLYLGFKKGISEGFVALVDFFMGLLDIIGEIAKLLSVSLRLFGNIYAAGMVLGTVISGIIAYVLPSIFTGLGLLFGAVQAVVFSALITVYYVLSLPEDSSENIQNEGEIII